ncbi:MAG: hypothetical protein IMF06_10755 [Proteobacteria bacterium]|nr:hypothetical protein [Pseudomonadota bacterium]
MNSPGRKFSVVCCAVLASVATAATQHTIVKAPVVAVEPLVRTVTRKIPHESCFDERVRVVQSGVSHPATPGILGAVIGGVVAGSLGHNSRYQPVIAGAGALLGASIGHDVAHSQNSRSYYVTERRCEIDYELRDEDTIIGYRVSYQYGDKIYHAETRNDPGSMIELQVDLRPVE